MEQGIRIEGHFEGHQVKQENLKSHAYVVDMAMEKGCRGINDFGQRLKIKMVPNKTCCVCSLNVNFSLEIILEGYARVFHVCWVCMSYVPKELFGGIDICY